MYRGVPGPRWAKATRGGGAGRGRGEGGAPGAPRGSDPGPGPRSGARTPLLPPRRAPFVAVALPRAVVHDVVVEAAAGPSSSSCFFIAAPPGRAAAGPSGQGGQPPDGQRGLALLNGPAPSGPALAPFRPPAKGLSPARPCPWRPAARAPSARGVGRARPPAAGARGARRGGRGRSRRRRRRPPARAAREAAEAREGRRRRFTSSLPQSDFLSGNAWGVPFTQTKDKLILESFVLCGSIVIKKRKFSLYGEMAKGTLDPVRRKPWPRSSRPRGPSSCL